jgi:hypothetical protein
MRQNPFSPVISDSEARNRLNAKYKEANNYLAERVAYYNTLVEAETEKMKAILSNRN